MVWMKRKMVSKKGQHEIVGFVLIIVIVVIMGLVFLSFSINRQSDEFRSSAVVFDFLQSSMHHTSTCYKNSIPNYFDLQELVKECYRGNSCEDERKACDVLNETFSDIINKGFNIGVGKNKGYELSIYYKDFVIEEVVEVLRQRGGVVSGCKFELGGLQSLFVDNGNINIELVVCRG